MSLFGGITREVIVYEVDSDRGTYWESEPFIPEIWGEGSPDHDPWPIIQLLTRKGHEVTVKSQAAYLEWLRERGEE